VAQNEVARRSAGIESQREAERVARSYAYLLRRSTMNQERSAPVPERTSPAPVRKRSTRGAWATAALLAGCIAAFALLLISSFTSEPSEPARPEGPTVASAASPAPVPAVTPAGPVAVVPQTATAAPARAPKIAVGVKRSVRNQHVHRQLAAAEDDDEVVVRHYARQQKAP